MLQISWLQQTVFVGMLMCREERMVMSLGGHYALRLKAKERKGG